MSAVFLETSALGRALFGEKGGAEVNEALRRANRIVASRLLKVEIERAIMRQVIDDADFEKQLSKIEAEAGKLWARVNFIEITRDICERAGKMAPRSRLRTLDAIHLATFRLVQKADPAVELLTFDERLREAL